MIFWKLNDSFRIWDGSLQKYICREPLFIIIILAYAMSQTQACKERKVPLHLAAARRGVGYETFFYRKIYLPLRILKDSHHTSFLPLLFSGGYHNL